MAPKMGTRYKSRGTVRFGGFLATNEEANGAVLADLVIRGFLS